MLLPANTIRAYKPYDSYRYSGRLGWVYIGALSVDEALSEAYRSISPDVPRRENLQKWNGERYASLLVSHGAAHTDRLVAARLNLRRVD